MKTTDAFCPCGSGQRLGSCHAAHTRPVGASLWHAIDNRLVLRMVEDARRFPHPEIPFCGDDPAFDEFFPVWIAYVHDFKGRKLASWFLDREGANLAPDERKWLDAQLRAWLSIWQVSDVVPGVGFNALDLLTGERRLVHERTASQQLPSGDTLLARIVDIGGESLVGGMYGMSLNGQQAAVVAEEFIGESRLRFPVAPEALRGGARANLLATLWQDAIEDAASPVPALANTDGDPLALVEERFTFAPEARAEIRQRLASMRGAEVDGSEIALVRRSDDTVVARIALRPKFLKIETNSIARADNARDRVARKLGKLVVHKGRRVRDPREMIVKARAAGRLAPPPEHTPEEQAMVREYKERHYETWLRTPIPALGNLTPRQARQDPAIREALLELLRAIAETESRLPSAERYDVSILYRALRLERYV